MKPLIPMFYFPLKILFVDDDNDLLESYHHLDLSNNIATESDPYKAIEALTKNHVGMIKIFDDITDEQNIDALTTDNESVVKFTFKNIQTFMNNDDKYDKYGIVVVDYKMPEMNGIELCNQINSKIDIIKILLTGEYKPLDALTAVNENRVDNYIPKGKPTTFNDLVITINALQLKYFINATKNYCGLLENKFDFLFDTAFAELINSSITNYNIVEYYLLSNTGSFLMKNKTDSFIINTYTDKDLDVFCDMYEHIDHSLLNKVKSRQLIPNFKIPKNIQISDYFYPATKSGQYYYHLSKIEDTQFLQGII